MNNPLKSKPRFLVQVLEPNGKDHFRKYPIDQTGNVIIEAGGKGRGQLSETPQLSSEYERYKGWGIFKQKYAIYPRGSGEFLKRNATTITPVNVKLIKDLINVEALRAYTGKESTPFILYISFAMIALLLMMNLGVLKL